jgi:1,4-alpha-glucan branching enzyme
MVTIQPDGFAEFRFYRPGASRVWLVGDFNHWRAGQLQMFRQQDGYWMLKLGLPPGEYRFRYVADGLWYTDFAAFGVEPGRFGLDSVLRVAPQAVPAAAAA